MKYVIFLIPFIVLTLSCGPSIPAPDNDDPAIEIPAPPPKQPKLLAEIDVNTIVRKEPPTTPKTKAVFSVINVVCGPEEKDCNKVFAFETKDPNDKNLLINFTAKTPDIDANSGKIRFNVPRLAATCSLRCPNTIGINVEIVISNAGNEQFVVPTELENKTIQARRNCQERRGHSLFAPEDTKPPCVYEFLPYTRTFSTPIHKNATQNSYRIKITQNDHASRRPDFEPVKMVVEAPIVFEWH